ncbi:MAG: ATP-binding cassette domain-containing protein, partial [Hydrogenophaga sp.]
MCDIGLRQTTTLSILTGELAPTSGAAFIHGADLASAAQRAAAFRNAGYCPQFDALFEFLTVWEHLVLYARLRGMGPAQRAQEADYW